MTFSDLNLNKSILNALDDLGLEEPTPIQAEIFSVVMSGKDTCGIAQTGTGKTFAYLMPLLRMWSYSKDKLPQILIIVPTRELVAQVLEQVNLLTTYMNFDSVGVFGGVNMKTQVAELYNGCDLIVATPGRFIDLAAAGALKVKNIKKVVVDEFDMMLDLGFRPQLASIFDKIPKKRQNLLFSATLNEDVQLLLDTFFYNPVFVEVAESGQPLENIEQKSYFIPNFHTKINFLELLLFNDKEMTKNLVFVSDKSLANLVCEELTARGVEGVDVIHSNKSQNYRFNVVNSFEEGVVTTLIATDIVSRGLDITDVSHVINLDFPEETETYIHRIGRTGRYDKKGVAISLFTEKEIEDKYKVEALMGRKIPLASTPSSLEISEEIMPFEREQINMKTLEPKKKIVGDAFHDKKDKNKKVNVRRDIEKERKLKYGKSYKKESKH